MFRSCSRKKEEEEGRRRKDVFRRKGRIKLCVKKDVTQLKHLMNKSDETKILVFGIPEKTTEDEKKPKESTIDESNDHWFSADEHSTFGNCATQR